MNEQQNNTQNSSAEFTQKMEGHMGALESWMQPLFEQLPHLPGGVKKTIADVLPWLALIFGVLGFLGLVTAGLITTLLSPLILLGGGFNGLIVIAHIILGLISAYLSILAFKPLQERLKKGWNYIFYGEVLSVAGALLYLIFSFGHDGNVGGIVGAFIGFYLLFEVRGEYK